MRNREIWVISEKNLSHGRIKRKTGIVVYNITVF